MERYLSFTIVLAFAISAAYGSNITANSDSGVTFLDSGFTSTDFSSPFTAADFAAARTGTAAAVQASTPSWISSLPSAPSAEWIGTNSSASTNVGDTALYALGFTVAQPFSSAALTLYYSVDNILGANDAGVYLNGNALPLSTGIGSFGSQYTYTDANIGGDLVQGTNWLYIDAVNLGGPAGLIFSANILTANSASSTPEPASLLLFSLGVIAIGISLRREKRCLRH